MANNNDEIDNNNEKESLKNPGEEQSKLTTFFELTRRIRNLNNELLEGKNKIKILLKRNADLMREIERRKLKEEKLKEEREEQNIVINNTLENSKETLKKLIECMNDTSNSITICNKSNKRAKLSSPEKEESLKRTIQVVQPIQVVKPVEPNVTNIENVNTNENGIQAIRTYGRRRFFNNPPSRLLSYGVNRNTQ